MKEFNKERELNKLRLKNNKNKYIKYTSIILSVLILVVGIIYFTFAMFESNQTFTLINGRIGEYSGSDVDLVAYYYGNAKHDAPPANDGTYVIDTVSCDNASGTWDNSRWGLYVDNITGKVKCSLTFKKSGDQSGANAPVLYTGMVPVYYTDIDKNGSVDTVVADTTKEWYNYGTHNWANAVLVDDPTLYLDSNNNVLDAKKNTKIESGIKQYYVWIPRYKYELFNANNGSVDEQMINVTFESGTASTGSGSTNGEELTHPAFTFGTTELPGFWVGKFETTGSSSTPTILPNSYSLTSMTVSAQFNSSRSIEGNYGTNASEIDTHMMKNMEWGAVAYLSASKYGLYKDASTCNNSDNTVTGVGCQIWINNVHTQASGSWGTSITGCSALTSMNEGVRNNTTECVAGYEWNGKVNNGRSSTTGNLYGIYDMSGGAWEYVMGNRGSSTSVYVPQSSGFTSQPESKYIDIYEPTSSNTDHAKGKLGDATKETLKTFGNENGGWYSDRASFVESSYAWFRRGGGYDSGASAGAFNFNSYYGPYLAYLSFRVVLSAQ